MGDGTEIDPDETASRLFEGWCILELYGHRRLGGLVSEQEIAGKGFLRIDVPGKDEEPVATQFYAAGAIFSLTPTTEEMARAVAAHHQPTPVQRWELPAGPHPDDFDVDDEPEDEF